MNQIEDVLFMGLDIPNEVRNEMVRYERKNTNNMTVEEVRAYQLGVDCAISCLRKMLIDGEHLYLHINNQPKTEYTLNELANVYTDKMLLYTE